MERYQLDNVLQQNSSNGRLYKQFIGDKLIKTSSIHENGFESRFNYEAVGEYLVYKICKYLNIPEEFITPYKLCEVRVRSEESSINTVGCECKLFTGRDEKYLSFYNLLRLNNIIFSEMQGIDTYRQIVSIYIKALGQSRNSEHLIKFLNTIFIIDSIVLNSDRHLGNFGFIVNKTGGILREAPIFDNGNSLFCNKPFEDLGYDQSLNRYISHRPIARDFDYVFGIIDINNTYIDKSKLKILPSYVSGLCTRLVNTNLLPQSRSKFIVQALESRVHRINLEIQ